ncbi:retrotransposon protein, putative, ty1-copia subclass [Tanacetum coccineum]
MTTTVVNNSLFRSLFEKQKLTRNNFLEWYRNLRIVLSTKEKLPFLEQPIPALPVPPQGQANPPDVITTHQAWVKAQKEIARLMLMTMDPEIQKTLEHLGAYDMLNELKTLYVQQADQELLQTVREFHACKHKEGQSVSSYVLKMKSYIDNLEHLSHAMTQNLSVSLILVSLRKEYEGFVQNYNMHRMGKTVNELHAMLKLHEKTLPPKEVAPALHAIRAGRIQKNQKKKSHKAAKGNQGKGKAKMGYAPVQALPFAPKPKNPPTPKKDNPTKDAICHQCGEVGHWRRNCPIYLLELMKMKKLSQGASTSGIFTIELYYFPSTYWVYDSGCGTHIFITTQGLRGSRKLKPGALSLYVGDGHRASVEAIGDFHLCLPSRLVLIVHNCHYAPSITRGIISVSLLAKLNLDSAVLWHCRLGHINKKRIEKLQHDGLLDSTDIESFEKCVACMSGKMARKPYSHQVERAKDLLGLIHTYVCGPFKIMSRQGAYYFVTFIDDFSRYGHVYLFKHKNEVFETFKVFQKEVENQLGKTIKSLRSDRGGEYKSQEFLDHIKDHGIIAHRTPPYTPQHNGVLERRNRTLLDMVRSMMTQTTLPKSFWDYALESTARILNMVPTKKVEKTLHEVRHGQAPKLSYLKVWGCEELVKRDTLTKSDKLEPRSIKCILIGYPKETIGYSFYYPPENKIFVAQNAEFLENSMINHEASGRDLGKPANYKAALLDPESDKWLNAMNVKMQSMKDNEVWELVDLPPNGKTVGHKWLFKKKTDIDGAVHTYKAHIRAIRILIAIDAFYDYEIWQMDVKTAFLNGYLNEEVYMEQPKGFVSQKFPNRVCKLKRSIYGLKQASRQWNKRFDDEIKKFGFNQNRDEPCVYVKASGSYVTFLILYVDDILIMGNNIPMLQDVKSYLGRCFAMKDLGVSCYTDAGYLTDADDLKSQTGYVFVLNGGVEGRKGLENPFLGSVGVPIFKKPINMYCDNTGAIAIANESGTLKGLDIFRAKGSYFVACY